MAASEPRPQAGGRPTASAEVLDGAVPGATLDVERADTILRRTLGLMGRRGLPDATGLLIEPCGSVHTSFMRFPLDVVYLDRDRRVVKVATGVRPWRLSAGGRRAKATLELAAGEAERLGIVPGARVRIDDE